MNLHSYVFFFFFSSRRRHTRYWRDWSSDVCSSDLAESYDSPCQPTNFPTLTSVSDSWDSSEFDFVNSFARDDYSDSDWEAGEEEITDDTLQSPSKPINFPNQ